MLVVHPDKVMSGTPEMRAIAERVFDVLQLAFKKYEVKLGLRAPGTD